MPYTPPSQRSPAASEPATPALSRNNSYVKSLEHPVPGVGFFHGPRPGLPRSSSSTSYLNRERRSPTAPKYSPSPDSSPILEDQYGTKSKSYPSASLRQSPPPVNGNFIPTGAVMSPPDSTQNSSDDEEIHRGRPRTVENIAELQAAISAMELRRDGSPEMASIVEMDGKPKLVLDLSATSSHKFDSGLSPPLSKEARKISHSRSNTEPVVMDLSRTALESPDRSSDSDMDEERMKKPPMLRKKSGELVRPALRPPSAKRRPSSMPGTPTYSKMVHFDNQLEHVRTFLQVDRPAAVSAGSSPVDPYESETEFPFSESDRRREPPWEWEIKTPNFPASSADRKQLPVRVERVFLSSDKKFLVGSVIVKNLAFHKSVVARFTLDYWKTTSEVSAEYSHDVHKNIDEGCDRFMFNIKLEDQTKLENKTLFFCVRYNVNGQEFWDNNNSVNFQVEFSKKALPQRGKNGMQGNASKPLTSLPRSRPSPPTSSGRSRPKSMPSFDDFANDFDGPFSLGSPPSAASIIGEKPIKFRNKSSNGEAPGLKDKISAQAFGNRYDISASLSATKVSGDWPSFTSSPRFPPETTQQEDSNKAAGGESQKPAALSEKPSLSSQSYNDLINKYCFVRSTNTLGSWKIEC
jgi:hypothetical protein